MLSWRQRQSNQKGQRAMIVSRWGNSLSSVDGDAPVSRQEAITHLNLPPESTLHNEEIDLLLLAAEEAVEKEGIDTRDKTYKYDQWNFPTQRCGCNRIGAIVLPKQALMAVTSVEYQDDGGSPIVIDPTEYHVVVNAIPGYIMPVTAWPTAVADPAPGNVSITYQAGPAADRTNKIKVAMLQLVSSWFETRSAAFTGTMSAEMELATRYLLTQINWGDEFANFDNNWC
jgi:uncharacterized phiE125 gp8 family phage protein